MDQVRELLLASRATEKAGTALHTLAVDNGNLRPRLMKAWFKLSILNGRQLSPGFQQTYDHLLDIATLNGPMDDTIGGMSEEDLYVFAEETYSFCKEVLLESKVENLRT